MRSLQARFLLLCLIELVIVFDFCAALYEDQIKKFDWTLENIGELIDAQFDWSDYSPRILVTTKENVLAALCPRTGAVLWRKIFEDGPRGTIRFFHLENSDSSVTAAAVTHQATARPSNILTVTGHAPAIVRGWSALTGNVEWEWSLMSLQPDYAEQAKYFLQDSMLYHVISVWGSHLEVSKYFPMNGQSNGRTAKLNAPWIQEGKCVLAAPLYVCLDKNQLIWIDLTEDTPQIQQKAIESSIQPKAVKGRKGTILVDNKIIELGSHHTGCEKSPNSNVLYAMKSNEPVLVFSSKSDKVLQITEVNANTCEKSNEIRQVSLPSPQSYGDFSLEAIDCKQRRNTNKIVCHYLLSTSDGAIIMTDGEKIRWAREESCTKLSAVEFIDLPLSDAEGAIENELASKPGDIAGAFVRRISSQILQVKNLFLTVMGLGTPPSATQRAGLIRDAFGLHKIIVAVSQNGKLFGIDNLNGKIYWMRYLPMLSGFSNDVSVKLIVHRTAKHFPHPPLNLLIGKEKITGFGLIYRFNPITGQPLDGDGIIKLNYRIKQMAVLRENEPDFIRPVLLLDENNNVHLFPETSSKEIAHGMYMFTADRRTAILEGFYIDASSEKITAKPIWKINLGGQENTNKLVQIAAKNPNEHVHSQGRVLSDRSVLYKYINPNLVAVATQSLDSIHKYILNIYLVDVVSGSIIYSMSHRKARGPLHIVHSENWLVYSYYNDKVRRTEITSVELYEGRTQTNSTVWSSLDALPVPLIEKQSYILPSNVETMRETITERGITNKHVLIGISSGAVIEMPWALLDPRRPTSTANGNQAREEGAIPYIPELPLPTENIINYNQTISRIRNIHTAPSGLESTCLVIAYGLDIFVTRVAPSKTFDLLKEDFDYFLITVVLIALITGSFVAKHLSMRKALKQAWK